MSKKSLIKFIFAIVILSTFSCGVYDIISAYNRDWFIDDISAGMLGVLFRTSLLTPIIVAEISMFCDAMFFVSNCICKMDFISIIHIISFGISIAVIVFSTICYMGSTNKIIEALILVSIIALLLVKTIDGLFKIHR